MNDTYTDLLGNTIEPPELNWLATDIDINGDPVDCYSTSPDTRVWLDDDYQEVEMDQ